VARDATGILAEHGQAHGDLKPVEHVLGFWGDQLCQSSYLLAAVGQEGHVLVVGQFEFFASEKLRDINAFKCL